MWFNENYHWLVNLVYVNIFWHMDIKIRVICYVLSFKCWKLWETSKIGFCARCLNNTVMKAIKIWWLLIEGSDTSGFYCSTLETVEWLKVTSKNMMIFKKILNKSCQQPALFADISRRGDSISRISSSVVHSCHSFTVQNYGNSRNSEIWSFKKH